METPQVTLSLKEYDKLRDSLEQMTKARDEMASLKEGQILYVTKSRYYGMEPEINISKSNDKAMSMISEFVKEKDEEIKRLDEKNDHLREKLNKVVIESTSRKSDKEKIDCIRSITGEHPIW